MKKSLRPPLKIGLLVLLIVALCGGAYWFGAQRNKPKATVLGDGVPQAVSVKYDEVKSIYADSLGATLRSCIGNNEKIYVVDGSSGYVTEGFYYRSDGSFIGYSHEDDVLGDGNEKAAPIDLKQYTCTTLQTSN